jgi:hypothetical protein
MAINRLYNKTVSTKRLATVGGSHKEEWQTYLPSVPCHIQPAGGEQDEFVDGAFYKRYKMWCSLDNDIIIGDRVVDGSVNYTVKGVSRYDIGTTENQHLSVLLVEGI